MSVSKAEPERKPKEPKYICCWFQFFVFCTLQYWSKRPDPTATGPDPTAKDPNPDPTVKGPDPDPTAKDPDPTAKDPDPQSAGTNQRGGQSHIWSESNGLLNTVMHNLHILNTFLPRFLYLCGPSREQQTFVSIICKRENILIIWLGEDNM
jgi:hypothetical protein